MYNEEKIGVGILTCNRRTLTEYLVEKVRQASDVDCRIVVKNRDYDYGDFQSRLDGFRYLHVPEDVGVGRCKNEALTWMLDKGCDHMFLIEDDVVIKDVSVFRAYIDVAKEFGLGHLVFGYGSSGQQPGLFDESKAGPYCSISGKSRSLDIYFHLQGGFCYFSRKALQKVGLMDDVHYVNALEHVEHTYRLCVHGFHTPFWAFADLKGSRDLLDWHHEGMSYSTTIDQDEKYKTRLRAAYEWFRYFYGRNVGDIPRPSQVDLVRFFQKRLAP